MFGSDDVAGGAEDVLDGAEPKAVRRPFEDARVAMLIVLAAAAAAACWLEPRSDCSDDDNGLAGAARDDEVKDFVARAEPSTGLKGCASAGR